MRYHVFLFIYILLDVALVFAQGPPPAKVVLAQVVQEEVAENQSVIGVIYYERVSEVSTEVAGLVEKVAVSQGDRVKKGELLVSLNTEILDQEIALARTRIEQIDLRIENSKKHFNRLEKLYKESGVSEKDYDDSLYNYQDAGMEKQATMQQLQKLLIQKKRSLIKAPFDGIILSKDVDSGAWVQQGKKLLSVGSINDLFVRAPIAEKLLQFINMGETVPVVLNGFNKEIKGVVEDIDPLADVKTKNVFLKIKIDPLPLIAQNMSATVFVPAGPKRMLSIIKRAALIKFQGKDFVYTVKDGKAAILPVKIVSFMGERVGIDHPAVQPGMSVVVEGNERLRPEQAVVVSGAK